VNIFVCIKEIQNPELVADLFRVDEARKEVIPVRDMPLVTSPFDEQAIEAALRIRDTTGAATISALTLGPKSSLAALKRALSMGADKGILVSDEALARLDAFGVATALCCAIRKSGPFDLILTGRQAADWDAGIVGCGIAEILGVPVVTFAKDVRVESDRVVVERVLDDGFELVETRTPCVVTISNELGEPRKASLRETMRAAKKPIVSYDAACLDLPADLLDAGAARQTRERLFVPAKDGTCEMLAGESPAEIARRIIARLRQGKYLQ
jgi:electron transfer flavoprotein beta subunit